MTEMVVYNDSTLFAAVVGLVFGFGMYSFSRSANAAFFTGMISIIVFDLVVRTRNHNQEAALISPESGGHVWFIPNWITGIVAAGISGLIWMGFL